MSAPKAPSRPPLTPGIIAPTCMILLLVFELFRTGYIPLWGALFVGAVWSGVGLVNLRDWRKYAARAETDWIAADWGYRLLAPFADPRVEAVEIVLEKDGEHVGATMRAFKFDPEDEALEA